MGLVRWVCERFGHKHKTVSQSPTIAQHRLSFEDIEKRLRILNFPIKTMSQAEFDKLPKDATPEFLKTCPFGTWFVCKPSDLVPDLVIVGQIVTGLEQFADQHGGGLPIRDREINRYRLQIVQVQD